MNEEAANAAAAAAASADAEAAKGSEGSEGGESKGEGTTPEEVAAVLKGSGINIKAPVQDDAAKEAEAATKAAEEAKAAEAAAGGESDETKAAADAQAAEEAEIEAAAEAEAAAAAERAKAAASGDAGAKEFSFKVVDKNGKEFTVNAGDNIDDVLAEFELKSSTQAMSILRQLDKIEAEKANYEKDQQEETANTERAAVIESLQKTWADELKDLQAQKRIPAGTDNDRINEVYKFMAAENTKRIDQGRPTIQSFEDALDKLENQETRAKAVEADKVAKEEARANGGKVGGSSAPAANATPVYRANSARNANEAIRALGLLK
jgi:hypothetical protein